MWSILLLCLYSFCAHADPDVSSQGKYTGAVYQDNCVEDRYVVYEFRKSYDEFSVKLCQIAAQQANYYVSISAYMTWLTLAAIAEGADQQTQNEIFKVLNLPRNICTRQKFYNLATSRISLDKFFNVAYNRALFIDQDARLNMDWFNLFKNTLVEVIPTTIKQHSDSASEIIKQFISLERLKLDFSGNSVLVNLMDYTGFWTTSFGDAVIQRSAFYSFSGKRIGAVDLMKVKRRVRIAHSISIFSKLIELPIGSNGQYRMLIGLIADGYNETAIMDIDNNIMIDMAASLQDSVVPIDVAIPQFVMTSEIDMKAVLQDVGIKSLWRDPRGTRHISNPPALPSSYIQRVRVNLNTVGVNPPPILEQTSQHIEWDKRYSQDFIANRPFCMGILDTETFTNLLVMMYTQPTYRY